MFPLIDNLSDNPTFTLCDTRPSKIQQRNVTLLSMLFVMKVDLLDRCQCECCIGALFLFVYSLVRSPYRLSYPPVEATPFTFPLFIDGAYIINYDVNTYTHDEPSQCRIWKGDHDIAFSYPPHRFHGVSI